MHSVFEQVRIWQRVKASSALLRTLPRKISFPKTRKRQCDSPLWLKMMAHAASRDCATHESLLMLSKRTSKKTRSVVPLEFAWFLHFRCLRSRRDSIVSYASRIHLHCPFSAPPGGRFGAPSRLFGQYFRAIPTLAICWPLGASPDESRGIALLFHIEIGGRLASLRISYADHQHISAFCSSYMVQPPT